MNDERACNKTEINVKSSPVLYFDFSSSFFSLSLYTVLTRYQDLVLNDIEPRIQLRKYFIYTCQ